MEEIETHQHPSSLRMLIKSLIEIAKENRLQLFVSTQSPDALRYFKMFHPETKVLLIEKDLTEDVVYVHDQEKPISIFQEIGWDYEDLLRYERIAIVDGIEDEIIIQNFFQKERGYSLESEGVKPLVLRGNKKRLGEIVKTLAISNREFIVIKDLDEMKNRDEAVALIVSWLKSLENEGWRVQEDEQQVIGEHPKSRKRWKMLKANILKAGNPQRFPDYKRHSITDYLLEAILDHPDLFSNLLCEPKISGYQLKAEDSKGELEFLFGKYNMDIVKLIVQTINKDIIPNSIKEDIVNAI